MSRFYSSINSKRTTHTKCGNKDGMSAHIRGWNIGVQVNLSVNEKDQDVLVIHLTKGSNNPSIVKCLFSGTEAELNE